MPTATQHRIIPSPDAESQTEGRIVDAGAQSLSQRTPKLSVWVSETNQRLGRRIDEAAVTPDPSASRRWGPLLRRFATGPQLEDLLRPWQEIAYEDATEFGDIAAEQWPPE